MEMFKIYEMLKNLPKEEAEMLATTSQLLEEMRRPGEVVISAEEKAKMDEIMDVFQEYIDGHYYFDIVFSKKYGFLRLDKEGNFRQMATADDLMECLFDEISNDVRELQLCGAHRTTKLDPIEEEEVRKRILPLLNKLADRDRYHESYCAYAAERMEGNKNG